MFDVGRKTVKVSLTGLGAASDGRGTHADGLGQMIDELTDNDLSFELPSGRRAGSQAMQPIEDAIEASLRAFAASIETQVERYAVLEEISKNCVTIWFRFHANDARNADACSSVVDPALLKYAAQGVVTILSWMDGPPELRLADLQKALRVLAWGTSANSCTHPTVPSSTELVKAVAAWDRVRESIRASGAARLITSHGSAKLNLSKRIPDLTALFENRLVSRELELILLVERPDYGATGKWMLKHGQTRYMAQCRNCELLEQFHHRQLDIRPGDALRCRVEIDTSYGPDHEVVQEHLSVVEILEVLPATVFGNENVEAFVAQAVDQKTVAKVKDTMLVF